MTIDINFGYETENIKLDGPDFNRSTGFEKGIVRYKDTYDSFFKGDNVDDEFESESDITEDKHIFKAGTKIALIENYDWHENLSEFAGEIEFLENTNVYFNRESGCVYFILGKRLISFSGEYYNLDDKYKDLVNKAFNTDYVEIFVGN